MRKRMCGFRACWESLQFSYKVGNKARGGKEWVNEGRAGDECYEMKFHSSLFTLFKLGTEQRQQENELHNTFPVCGSLSCSSFADVLFFWEWAPQLSCNKDAKFYRAGMESLWDNRRAGASVGCVARVFETLGDTESNQTPGTVLTEDSRNYWQWQYSVAEYSREKI